MADKRTDGTENCKQFERLNRIGQRNGYYSWGGLCRPWFHIRRLRKALADHYVSQILAGEVSPPAGAAGQYPFYF